MFPSSALASCTAISDDDWWIKDETAWPDPVPGYHGWRHRYKRKIHTEYNPEFNSRQRAKLFVRGLREGFQHSDVHAAGSAVAELSQLLQTRQGRADVLRAVDQLDTRDIASMLLQGLGDDLEFVGETGSSLATAFQERDAGTLSYQSGRAFGRVGPDVAASVAGSILGAVRGARGAAPKSGQKLLPAPKWQPTAFKPGQLDSHFAKHASEWGSGNITKGGYLTRARQLLSKEPGGDILHHVRSNGDILRYNARTNEFAVAAKNGTIRTMFRPEEGMDYWLKQVSP